MPPKMVEANKEETLELLSQLPFKERLNQLLDDISEFFIENDLPFIFACEFKRVKGKNNMESNIIAAKNIPNDALIEFIIIDKIITGELVLPSYANMQKNEDLSKKADNPEFKNIDKDDIKAGNHSFKFTDNK